MKIGAQLYTVRDFCKTKEDFSETLKKVADIGYTTVQVSGTCEYEAEWLKNELSKTGLKCVLTHYNLDKIKNSPKETADFHKVFDCKYVGIGALPGGPDGLEKFDEFVNDFLPSAKILKENGAYLMYHNHNFDLCHIEPKVTYLERMAEIFGEENLGITLDTYWVQAGGASITEWLEKFKGRVPCIHLKDMSVYKMEQRMASVGSGNINFEKVIEKAEEAQTEYLLVEQDNCYGKDPFDELKNSYSYLRSLGLN